MVNILLVGNDVALLSTRALVLSKAQAKVTEATPSQVDGLREASGIDLVFMCHTLDEDQRASLALKAHEDWPMARILQIAPIRNMNLAVPTYADEVVSPQPDALVDTVRRLLLH
jgi:hypothetical protein